MKIIRALIEFTEQRSGRHYRVGDVIDGWDDSKIAAYAARGKVRVDEAPDDFRVEPFAYETSAAADESGEGDE